MFFLFILFIVLSLGLAIYTSRIGIEVENLIIDTESKEKINQESKIYVYLLIFKKIKIFKKDIKNIDLKKLKFQNKDIDIKFLKNKDLKINYKELLQNIDVDIEQIDLYIQIGVEDAAITAILVGFISGILGVILRKPKYKIVPIYSGKNLIKIKLDGIFTIDLMHYISKVISNKTKTFEKKNNIIKQESGGII